MDRALELPHMQVERATRLPLIREELRLLPADANRDGSPAWMIHDPIANRFFRIGWMDFEMLTRWQLGTPEAIAQAVSSETTLDIHPDDAESLALFLRQHGLLQPAGTADVDSMRERAAAHKPGVGEWLLHHYLFFRLPLVRPQEMLAQLIPRLAWLFTPAMLLAVGIATLTGIVMVSHQWDTFTSSFVDHLTWHGAVGFAIAVAFAKTLHELGHAFTATRYGVRVAHMGVALVVMFPMLYTDTSESWKLTSARQRLAIASAGIITELALAGIATLLWCFTPDGLLRTALFFLASTSWLLTLAVNASPFMRFDGYFILCDVLNFPNLHERAGNLARTWVRRSMLGLPQPWPETLPNAQRRWLIAFAISTWVYRLVVFLGIATLVYVYFFKLLGIALMAVEIGWFIVRPVYSELKEWSAVREEVQPRRKLVAGLLVAVTLLVLCVPWHSSVQGAGVMRAARQHLVFAPRAGELKALPTRMKVAEGELLFALQSPDLGGSADRARALADARAQELVGLSGLRDGEERRAMLESERERFLAEASVFTGEQSRLQLVAPFAGRLADVDPQLQAGVWVQPRRPLAILIDPSQWIAEVFVAEEDVGRIKAGDAAKVYSGVRAISGKVVQIDTSRTTSLPYPMLDATYGGPIVTLPRTDERSEEHTVRDGLYRVRIALDEAPPRERMSLCSVSISGTAQALLHGVFDHALSVVIRESGF
ncbi:HlyD family efflux transporter periplasmic adaptor subunit [Caenimonas koreensis]|nr:HlyD family efflux transporter periplasmic adaptor subunit [Caenimonas koreensis]